MSAAETKRLKAQIRELETQSRKYLSDCICMQGLVEVCRDQRDLMLKATEGLLERFDIFMESDWTDDLDRRAYHNAREAVRQVREWRQT